MNSVLSADLLKKYDVPVPRYTSYPVLPHWKGITEEEWVSSVSKNTEGLAEIPLSLYVHIPYCKSLCSFCGCTKVITRDRSKEAPLVKTLLKELDLKIESYFKSNTKLRLKELHLGGGSPTWLSGEALFKLLDGILSRFINKNTDIAIEVDPRTLTEEHIHAMKTVGVKRVSLGVQDFNELTLAAIKRKQSYEQVLWACHKFRKANIKQINFDLVYGLPYQSIKSIGQTMEKVLYLKPSRIAFYSYAHIPHLKLAQRGVERHGLPSVELKRSLYEEAKRILVANSYHTIGMDHFALAEDELFLAHSQRSLHRNFMGYTVQNTQLLLGIGPSALSDSANAYYQNSKEVEEWMEMVSSNSLSPRGGHVLSVDELIMKKNILELMCHGKTTLDTKRVEGLVASEIVKDELLDIDFLTSIASVTSRGDAFVRNICAEIDPSFNGITNLSQVSVESNPTFSRGI